MNLGFGSPKRPIEAILVFKDPGDWYLDLQIMTDVILGGRAASSKKALFLHGCSMFSHVTARHIYCSSFYALHAKDYISFQLLQSPV